MFAIQLIYDRSKLSISNDSANVTYDRTHQGGELTGNVSNQTKLHQVIDILAALRKLTPSSA